MIFHWGFGGEATKLSYRRLSKLKGFWSAGDKIFGILWTQYLSSQRPNKEGVRSFEGRLTISGCLTL